MNTNRQCVDVSAIQDDIVEPCKNFSLVLDSNDDVVLRPEETEVVIEQEGSMW